MSKFMSPMEAIKQIPDGSVVAISGFNAGTAPFLLIDTLLKSYIETGHPRDLFIISDTLPAVPGFGLDKVGKYILENPDQKLVRGFLLPFYGWSPNLQQAVSKNLVEAYTWPIGIAARWFREVAAGLPGLITRVGLGTFIDPRQDGGNLNELAKKRRTVEIKLFEIDGKEYLFYKAPKPNVALIRGTTADEMGNLSMEQEPHFGTVLAITQATKARPGGIVIAQVLRVVARGEIHPKSVKVPGPLIDYVVVSRRGDETEKFHWQSDSFDFHPAASGDAPYEVKYESQSLNVDKVIARKVTLELVELVKKLGRPIIINLGIGIPTLVASVVKEEGLDNYIHATVESGPWGGYALVGADFGTSLGHYAVIPMPDQFLLYEGGAIDAASLGFLEIDVQGNVNPSFIPGRLPGPGGFPVIAAGSPRVYFAGEFTAGQRQILVDDGCKLKIATDGPIIKFIKSVYKIVFSAKYALEENKEVFYVTERAVFKLTPQGLQLVEVAPDIDIEKSILAKMEFKPIVGSVKEMDPKIFCNKKMGLREEVIKALRA